MPPAPLDAVDEARHVLAAQGHDALTIDALTFDDLDRIAWSGEPRHRVAVLEALLRVEGGEVEYLAVRVPSGAPVGKVGIDYAKYPEAGYLWQFATHPALQGQGIGSFLFAGAEASMRARHLAVARVDVEHDNPRARALYERLGFEALNAGGIEIQGADVTHLRKALS